MAWVQNTEKINRRKQKEAGQRNIIVTFLNSTDPRVDGHVNIDLSAAPVTWSRDDMVTWSLARDQHVTAWRAGVPFMSHSASNATQPILQRNPPLIYSIFQE